MKSDVFRVMRHCRPSPGFTLVELMVVVVVIGVIVAIAYPAYTDFVERSRRSEATEALQNLATLQEQYYNDNKAYTGSMGDLGMPTTTENAYYVLSITPGAAVDGTVQTYTLSASASAPSPQASDTECATIQLDSSGNKTPAECW